MVFSSTVFLFLFLPLCLIFYYIPIFKDIKIKNIILFVFSILFYAWGEPVFVFLMLGSIVVNWALGIFLDKKIKEKQKKIILIIAIIYDMGLLFIFKYLSFITKNIGLLINDNRIIVDLALPVGISFFTFQMMSYIIDVYRGNAKVQKNLLNLGLYISMFPQLIAGPIVRYSTIEKEINNRKYTRYEFSMGIKRFVYGLGKKVLFSNYFGMITDNIFFTVQSNTVSVATAWIGAIAYSFQIYFDFSGYSDMAIGLGLMFGFHFEENFNYPYIAKSVTDFWRRWHISLSTWFRDYIYIPLGGNRVSKLKWFRNIFCVWLFTGIWHGANWTFIAWGLYYFILLLIEKNFKWTGKIPVLSRVCTLFFIVIGWVLFRADTIGSAAQYIQMMFGISGNMLFDGESLGYLQNSIVLIAFGVIGCIPVLKYIKRSVVKKYGNMVNFLEGCWILLIFILALIITVKSTYNPFIYFNF